MKRTGWESRSVIVLKKVISLFFCRGTALSFPSAARRITKQCGYERGHVRCDLVQTRPVLLTVITWALGGLAFAFLPVLLPLFISDFPFCSLMEKRQPQTLAWEESPRAPSLQCSWNYSYRHIRNAKTEAGYPITAEFHQVVGECARPASSVSSICLPNLCWHTQQPPGLVPARGINSCASLQLAWRRWDRWFGYCVVSGWPVAVTAGTQSILNPAQRRAQPKYFVCVLT